MARNGSGTYSVVNTFVAGNTITASSHNANWTDIGAEITNSVAADGQTSMTAPLKAANGTVALPAYSFASDTNMGLYRIGADNLGIALNGVKYGDWTTTGLSITGTLDASGNFAVASTKFTVAAASGNTVVAGTLGVTSDLAVATNKFTVAAASGNTVVAGTLGVTGAATLSSTANVVGNFSVNTNKFNVTAASGNTTVAGTLGVTGLATLSGGISVGGALLTSSATGGIGYATGAGGTVTQLTSKTTGVTLNKVTGQIQMAAGSLGNQQSASFTFTNSTIAAGDNIKFDHISGGTIGSYLATAACAAGSATVTVINWTQAALNEQPVLQYSVIKGATS